MFDSTDSVGLPGLSNTGGKSAIVGPCGTSGLGAAMEDVRCEGVAEGREVPDPLRADRRRRRSSKGAPLAP